MSTDSPNTETKNAGAPTDAAQPQPQPSESQPQAKPQPKAEKHALRFLVALLVAFIVLVATLVILNQLNAPEPTPIKATVVATKELAAFTQIQSGDVNLIKGTDESGGKLPNVTEFTGRYILTDIKPGEEINAALLAPANWPLADTVALNLTPLPSLPLGNRLSPGDLIDVVAVSKAAPVISKPPLESQASGAKPSEPQTFGVMVLNIARKEAPSIGASADEKATPGEPSSITIAVRSSERDEFLLATTGATIVITRKLPLH